MKDYSLPIGADQGDNENAGVKCNGEKERGKREIRLDKLLYVSDQKRRDNVVGDGDEHYKKNENEVLFIGLCVFEESNDYFRVLHVAVEADRLFFIFQQSICDNKDQRENADDSADYENRKKIKHFYCPPPRPQDAADQRICDNRDNFRKAPHAVRQREVLRCL